MTRRNKQSLKFLNEGGDVNRLIQGDSLLCRAANCEAFDIAELLIMRGADINAADTHNWSPLHHAAFIGHTDMVKLLLRHNANQYAEDYLGRIPIYYAVYPEIIQLLGCSCVIL